MELIKLAKVLLLNVVFYVARLLYSPHREYRVDFYIYIFIALWLFNFMRNVM